MHYVHLDKIPWFANVHNVFNQRYLLKVTIVCLCLCDLEWWQWCDQLTFIHLSTIMYHCKLIGEFGLLFHLYWTNLVTSSLVMIFGFGFSKSLYSLTAGVINWSLYTDWVWLPWLPLHNFCYICNWLIVVHMLYRIY